MEIRELADPDCFLDCIGIFRLIADAPHAGIADNVSVDGLASLCSRIGDGLRIAVAAGHAGEVVFYQRINVWIRSQADHDDLVSDESGVPQTNGFGQSRYAKRGDAVGAKHIGDFHTAMAISIGFDDTGDLAVRSDLLADLADIEIQIGDVDFSPGGS